jgi:hypothetical protein
MAWFENLVTGVTWQVVDERHIDRCRESPDYQEVSDPTKKKRRKKRARRKSDGQSNNGSPDRPGETAGQ